MYTDGVYLVDTRDVDPFGRCRPSALLGFLQEAATQGAADLGLHRSVVEEEYGGVWILARIWYRLDRPLMWNDAVTVRTWHRGARGAAMYRDFDLMLDGVVVGEAVSVWVLADKSTHKLMRIGSVRQFEGTDGGELCKTKLLSKVRIPVALEPYGVREMHYSDGDINGHVNNTKYADFACDCVKMQDIGAESYVNTLEISYLKECYPGEVLFLSGACHQGVWYILGKGEEGNSRFDVRMTLSPIDKEAPVA